MKVTGLVQPIKVLMIEQTRPDFAAEGPALYQLELTTMCYEAGRLVRVRHGVPVDVPTLVTTVVLDFELGSWALTVNADDDTIRIATTEELRSEDVRLDDAPAPSRPGPVRWAHPCSGSGFSETSRAITTGSNSPSHTTDKSTVSSK